MSEASEPLSKAYDPQEVEPRWNRIWEERGYYHAEDQSSKPPFSISIPPPNVTGSLHIGHALTVSIEDLLIRWKRMSGFNTLWMPGTDHAGIATQMVVERELKKSEKKTRHDLGRAEFLKRVWQWKEQYGSRITTQLRTLGCSVDWRRERFTMDEGLSRAVREVFVRLYEEGLIYRAKKLINWCPADRTALSDLEVEHEEKNGSLWHIAYPVAGTDEKLIVATTRPETMLGDTAVAVHPDDPRYKHLHGKKVALPLTDREIPIITDPILVDMAFGSGAVKVTPAHDFNDYETGKRHNLEQLSVIDETGHMNVAAGNYAGLERFEARKRVVEDLEAKGLLVKTEPHKLNVGECQRCRAVVEPMLSYQWFVKIEPLAKPAIEAVEKGDTKFVPESWANTYFAWMRNIHDWCISRQLWWGHQIPAWYCPNGHVIVAREEPSGCTECGQGNLKRDDDVLDTWFSSGLWPFSTLGWPDETKALQTFYPNSVMETGHDIIFFWVARMMMFGIHFMGKVPFKTVYLHAMVRDEQGEKMSKVKGNVIDPLDVINGVKHEDLAGSLKKNFGSKAEYPEGMPAFGADALRFTLIAQTAAGRDIKLSLKRVEGYKAFANKLWNASRFALMNLGDYKPETTPLHDRPLSLADRWILSRLNRAVEETLQALETYRFNDAASTIYQFIWHELCDWYIELAKGPLYGKDTDARAAAQATLVHVLDQSLRLLHPVMPFVTEEIWTKLPLPAHRPESLVIAPYPAPEPRLDDEQAEAAMEPVMAAIDGLRNIRGETGIPFAKKLRVIVHAADASLRGHLQQRASYIKSLAGVEELTIAAGGDRPPAAATFVGAGMELFVPLAGLVDLADEQKRLEKQIQDLEADLAKLETKLSNPKFVERAPVDVVEKDRARVQELNEKRGKLKANLARIAGGSAAETPMNNPKNDQLEGEGKVTIQSGGEAKSGTFDLQKELAGDLAQAVVPAEPDDQVKHALEALREGTKEGLSAEDHKDLGVAYMQMGLVDDAVREFKASDDALAEAPKKPAKKAAAKKPAKKKAAAKKPAKKAAAKKVAKKAAKKPAKKAAAKKAKKPAKKAAKKPAKKAAKKKPSKKRR
ncbi:MAG: valine--tRNA ligase [Deltaproteobacteria bacterium]|nr:valine--tRNA ligase [Deltaproteobacteria bacterium]